MERYYVDEMAESAARAAYDQVRSALERSCEHTGANVEGRELRELVQRLELRLQDEQFRVASLLLAAPSEAHRRRLAAVLILIEQLAHGRRLYPLHPAPEKPISGTFALDQNGPL
jgi:hypothetical protein